MSKNYQEDLGFVYRTAKNGNVQISHNGKIATTLRGVKADTFIEEIKMSDFAGQQQLMARVTGNYKRGNERLARNHRKNH